MSTNTIDSATEVANTEVIDDDFDLDVQIIGHFNPLYVPTACATDDGCGSSCPSACVSSPGTGTTCGLCT